MSTAAKPTWEKVGPMVAGCATRELAEHHARNALTLGLISCHGASGWVIEESTRRDGVPLYCAWLAVRHG
jgi:hypothetical protein